LVSPWWTPRVLDEDVFLTAFDTPSDGEDGVVEIGSASGVVENTGAVVLEASLVSLDGNGGGSNSDGVLEVLGVVGDDILVGSALDVGLGLGVVLAGLAVITSSGNVRVVGGEDGVIIFVIFECEVHVSTIASVVAGGAVHELLLGEVLESTSSDFVGSFHSSGSGEWPAWSTSFLVLDGSDGSSGNPVDSSSVWWFVSLGILGEERRLVSEESLAFGISPGGEFVVCNGVRFLLSVDLVELGIDDVEDGLTEVEFLNGSVGEAEIGDVVHEKFHLHSVKVFDYKVIIYSRQYA
jgi:hypothetical protein